MSEKKSKVEDPIEEDSDFSDDDDQIEMDVDSGLTVNLALMGKIRSINSIIFFIQIL